MTQYSNTSIFANNEKEKSQRVKRLKSEKEELGFKIGWLDHLLPPFALDAK